MKDKLYVVDTREKCDALERELEKDGYSWVGGKLKSSLWVLAHCWLPKNSKVCVNASTHYLTGKKELQFANIATYKKSSKYMTDKPQWIYL